MANTKLGRMGHDDRLGAVNRLVDHSVRPHQWALEMALREPRLVLGSPDQKHLTQWSDAREGHHNDEGMKHTMCEDKAGFQQLWEEKTATT